MHEEPAAQRDGPALGKDPDGQNPDGKVPEEHAQRAWGLAEENTQCQQVKLAIM